MQLLVVQCVIIDGFSGLGRAISPICLRHCDYVRPDNDFRSKWP